jgi:hypothetical protein
MLILPEGKETVILQKIKNYKGDGIVLSNALGALLTAHLFGWRVLYILHNFETVKRYEQILGYSFKELTNERTSLSGKSFGLTTADKLGSFWKYVRNAHQVSNKGKGQLTELADANQPELPL